MEETNVATPVVTQPQVYELSLKVNAVSEDQARQLLYVMQAAINDLGADRILGMVNKIKDVPNITSMIQQFFGKNFF